MLADFKADLLVSQVSINPIAQRIQLFRQILAIFTLIVGDIQHRNLSRREPGWEGALVFLDQNTNEALKGTQHRPVQHDWGLALGIVGHILGTQATGHREIHLDGAALPDPANAVFQGEFNFRPVERALTRQQFPIHTFAVQGFFQCRLGFVPDLIGTHALFRAGRELVENLIEAKVLVDFV